jgi:MarR family transcriptional regulator, lower aerobic nicotinate degradation pathway regulator
VSGVEGSEAEATGTAAVNDERADGAEAAKSVQKMTPARAAVQAAGAPDGSAEDGGAAIPDRSSSAVALSTPILLRLAARRAADLLVAALTPLRLHPRHYGILLALAEGGPASQSALGQRLGIDRTTMVMAVDELEQLGYLARKPDPGDRRANRVELTGRGRGRLVRATGAVSAAEDRLLADLSPAEVQTLRGLLARLSP